MNAPRRRTSDLLKGRISIPGARYFVTICLQRPGANLAASPEGRALADIAATVFAPPDASLLCATLMPDHAHLLLALGSRLSLARLVAKFKAQSRRFLPVGAIWQRNFFEHRLRPGEAAGDYALYIFLNPYRKDLLRRTAPWPLWMLGPGVDFDFLRQLEDGGCPPPQWLEIPDVPPAGIAQP